MIAHGATHTRYMSMSLGTQLIVLFVLAVPIACVSWTVTHEEVFREPRDWCERRSVAADRFIVRKFFYLFTCEYCFSHYVTALVLVMTRYTLLFPDWRGYIIAGFSLVWIANLYTSLFGRLRLDIRHERLEIDAEEDAVDTAPPPRAASKVSGRR